MTLTQLTQLAVIPAALIVLGGVLLRRRASPLGGGRFWLFLLAAADALLLAWFVANRLPPAADPRLAAMVAALVTPVVLGVLALMLLHLKELRGMQPRARALALVLGVACLALLADLWGQPWSAGTFLVLGALLMALLWVAGRRSERAAIGLALAASALLPLLNAMVAAPSDQPAVRSAPWLLQLLSLLLLTLPVVAVSLAAVLTTAGLRRVTEPRGRWWLALGELGLTALLLGGLAYDVVWASIWDQTSDGLGGIYLAAIGALAAIAAGMVMGMTAAGWRRLAGLGFAVLVPALLFAAFNYGWRVSYKEITQARAQRLLAALEGFHVRRGQYPQALDDLVPRQLLRIPQPVILRGEGWCYKGGPDSYRLDTFYRETFSSPLSLRTFASSGEMPEASEACAARLVELKAKYDP